MPKSDFVDEPLTPEQKAEIPHALLELTRHVAVKGLQAGSLIGTAAGALLLLRTRPTSLSSALGSIGRTSYLTAAATAAVSVVAMDVILYREGWNAYRIWDRAYRLRHNKSQNRCDNFSYASAAVGAVIMQHPALRGVSPLRAALTGASIGAAEGVLLHVVSNPKEDVATATAKGSKSVKTTAAEAAGEKH